MEPTISTAIRYGGHHGRSTAVAGLLTALSWLWLHEIPAAAATRTVTLNGLEIGLDENNGGIVSLRYPNVGRILETEAASAALLDVAFPLAEYVPMRLATRFSRAVIEETDRGITITWPVLAPSRTHVRLPAGAAKARVTLTSAPDGRSIVMRCRIENSFSEPIPQILFPDFSGLRPLGTPEATRLTMGRGAVTPFTQRHESPHSGAFWVVDGGWRVYEATAYSYGPNVMSWLDYGSLKGGLSLFQKRWRDRDFRRPDILTHVTEGQPDRLRLACWQPAKLAPGEEWDGEVLDYTWNWLSVQTKEGHLTTTQYVEYVDAGAINNVLRSPRMNCNVESSPVALKKSFADGSYINFLLRKPDGENGSAILSEKPELSRAVKQAAARRRQFLPFFTDGTPIGDGILADPSLLVVRAHIRDTGALVVMVNEAKAPLATDLNLNPALWLPEGKHPVHRFDADGKSWDNGELTVKKGQPSFVRGRQLAPGEMEFLTIGEPAGGQPPR